MITNNNYKENEKKLKQQLRIHYFELKNEIKDFPKQTQRRIENNFIKKAKRCLREFYQTGISPEFFLIIADPE